MWSRSRLWNVNLVLLNNQTAVLYLMCEFCRLQVNSYQCDMWSHCMAWNVKPVWAMKCESSLYVLYVMCKLCRGSQQVTVTNVKCEAGLGCEMWSRYYLNCSIVWNVNLVLLNNQTAVLYLMCNFCRRISASHSYQCEMWSQCMVWNVKPVWGVKCESCYIVCNVWMV